MAALGWERYHLSVIETMAELNKEQIGSLGWDGPLAAISQTRVNLADYFKETVAVVTNPAIDRERERAQFSTSVDHRRAPGDRRSRRTTCSCSSKCRCCSAGIPISAAKPTCAPSPTSTAR